MDHGDEVRLVTRLDHPPDRVWRAWTEPSWLCGWHAEDMQGELHAHGQATLKWPSLGAELSLAVQSHAPPGRLVLRAGPSGRPPQVLTIEIAAAGSASVMTVTHKGFTDDAAGRAEMAGTRAGWYVSSRVLEHYLDQFAGYDRACASALGPAACGLETIGPLITTGAGWARWLCEDEVALSGEGERFVVHTHDDLILSGHILAVRSPYQLALAIDEISGVIVLRGIQIDPLVTGACLLGIQAWSWQPDEAPLWPDLVDSLAGSLSRLTATASGGRSASA